MTRLAGLQRNFPTFHLMTAPIRWIGRSRRRIWIAVLVLLAILASPLLWWATQLMTLPDIGDPFDVTAFKAMKIPDERNAFVIYREAEAVLKPWKPDARSQGNARIDMTARWSKADPLLRQWAEENRRALDLFRQGAERPDALDLVPPTDATYWQHPLSLQYLHWLALLEASRLEEQGDMAGAWGWYRDDLRAALHLMMHGSAFRWMAAQQWQHVLRDRLTIWAADPRTTPAMVRRALDDVVARESLAPSESYALKAEYLVLIGVLDQPKGPASEVPVMRFRRLWWDPQSAMNPEDMQAIWNAWRSWRREPERSRRVIRLMFANWLAYYQMPPGDRPGPDMNTNSAYNFYPIGPGGRANARMLSPQAIDSWLESTCDATNLMSFWIWNQVRRRAYSDCRELTNLLGEELYRRAHGTDPPNPEALVGPYLERLPPEMPDSDKDETIPMFGKPAK
jgi:hypothetical protein